MSSKSKSKKYILEKRKKQSDADRERYSRKKIDELCPADIDKAPLNLANYKKLKALMDYFGVESDKSLSYKEYCKLFRNLENLKKGCEGGGICCQAVTENGKRCKRAATKFTSIDLSRKSILPKIPSFIKKKLGAKKLAKLNLVSFANNCCFYCWQHAALFIGEQLTSLTNLTYYSTHPEDILDIFYDNVKPKKYGVVTYSFAELGRKRSADEIIRNGTSTYSASSSKLSKHFWIPFIMVTMYDQIKPYLLKVLKGSAAEKEKEAERIAILSAKVLLKRSGN